MSITPSSSSSSPRAIQSSPISCTNNSTTSVFLKKNSVSTMPIQQNMPIQHLKSPVRQHKDMGSLIHSTSLDSNILPNSHIRKSTIEDSIILYPLELTQSNPLPLTDLDATSILLETNRRHTITPNLGELSLEEQDTLKEVIAERMQARRASKRNMCEDEEDEDRVAIGTRVAEGHRNYQLM